MRIFLGNEFNNIIGSWSGAFRAGLEIYRDGGFRGLFQGHSATLLRVFPYAAIKFMAYDQVHSVSKSGKKILSNDIYIVPSSSCQLDKKRLIFVALWQEPSLVRCHPTLVSYSDGVGQVQYLFSAHIHSTLFAYAWHFKHALMINLVCPSVPHSRAQLVKSIARGRHCLLSHHLSHHPIKLL